MTRHNDGGAVHRITVVGEMNAGGIAHVARSVGVTRQTVYRIKGDPAEAEKAIAFWGE